MKAEDIALALFFGGKGGGTEQVQSDWNQTDTNAKDFIKNKPFDVESGISREIFNNSLDYQGEVSYVEGYSYHGTDEIPDLSPSDAGKTVTVTINGNVIESVLECTQEDDVVVYTASKDYDFENDRFLSNMSFVIQIIDFMELVQNSILCCIPDEVTEGIECSVKISDVSLTKLSGDKIAVDGESIVSEGGVLKAIASGGDNVFEVTEDTLSADLIDAWNNGKICVYRTEYNVFIGFYKYGNNIYFNSFQSDTYSTSDYRVRAFAKKISVSSPVVSISHVFDDYLVFDGYKATTSKLGLVKPDGTTITVDNNGKISAVGGGSPVLIITALVDTSTSIITTDVTFTEAFNAFKAGKIVMFKLVIMYDENTGGITHIIGGIDGDITTDTPSVSNTMIYFPSGDGQYVYTDENTMES